MHVLAVHVVIDSICSIARRAVSNRTNFTCERRCTCSQAANLTIVQEGYNLEPSVTKTIEKYVCAHMCMCVPWQFK